MKNKVLKAIDLFAGCGGLTDGFERTGFYETLACVEWEKKPCETLSKRLKDKWKYENAENIILRFDIQRTDELIKGWKNDNEYGSSDGLMKIIPKNEKVDIIIGGPPCQAYSVAGRIRDKKGMRDDYRNFLFESYIKVLNHFKPTAFIFENVPGILSASPKGTPIIEKIQKSFMDAGYSILPDLNKAIFDVSKFGVPQKRKRVIIFGVRTDKIKRNKTNIINDFYANLKTDYQIKKIKTVKEALFDLPPLPPFREHRKIKGKTFSHEPSILEIQGHTPRYHSSRDIEIFKELAKDVENGSVKYKNVEDLKELYTRKTGKKSSVHKYYVLRWNEPSNTIPAHLYKDGLRHIHPDWRQSRSITVREAARLQTFDDDFEFVGSMGDQYKMIGNAVPPLFGEILGRSVFQFFAKYNMLQT